MGKALSKFPAAAGGAQQTGQPPSQRGIPSSGQPTPTAMATPSASDSKGGASPYAVPVAVAPAASAPPLPAKCERVGPATTAVVSAISLAVPAMHVPTAQPISGDEECAPMGVFRPPNVYPPRPAQHIEYAGGFKTVIAGEGRILYRGGCGCAAVHAYCARLRACMRACVRVSECAAS